MFMIHSPQTMQLLADDPSKETAGEVHGTVTFDHETDDVSKCRMIVASNDRLWTYVFNTRGLLVDSFYEDDASRKAAEERQKKIDADLKAQRAKEQEAAKASHDHELSTADDTTSKDVSWDAPHAAPPSGFSEDKLEPFPVEHTPTPVGPNPFDPRHGNVNTTQTIARNRMMPNPVEDQHG
jgi:hypothetical protein